jgi:hypothetical protein
MSDNTLLRAQKNGRGTWAVAKIKWVDYHANLALVTVEDGVFWDGLEPIPFGKAANAATAMSLLRWKTGKLEQFRAEFKQYAVHDSRLSYTSYVQMEISSEAEGAGLAEPVVSGGKLLGIVCSHEGNISELIPSAFIQRIVEAHTKQSYPGLGYFDFVWQSGQNPTTLKFLGDTDPNHAVVIIEVPDRPGNGGLKPRDLILQVEGHDVDSTGDYTDPDYGYLSLENLATRDKWAGEDIKLTVLREGKRKTVAYTIPKAEYTSKLVPDYVFDHPPEYMIFEGLVFQPLTDSYLRSWGNDWKRRAPFRLNYYNSQPATKERPSLVLLSQVLPDPSNLGYQEDRFLVVDKVNGFKVAKLADVQEALKKPKDGFHIFEFMEGERLLKIVLDADGASDATRRVLERYGIEQDHVFN